MAGSVLPCARHRRYTDGATPPWRLNRLRDAVWTQPLSRTNSDDHTTAPVAENGNGVLHEHKGRGQVDGEHLLLDINAHLLNSAVQHHARIIDQDINTAIQSDRMSGHCCTTVNSAKFPGI